MQHPKDTAHQLPDGDITLQHRKSEGDGQKKMKGWVQSEEQEPEGGWIEERELKEASEQENRSDRD